MRDVIITVLYMISAVLFIRGIKLLGKADTARKGNGMSAVGMLIAVVTVLFEKQVMDAGAKSYLLIAAAVVVGSMIGAVWAKKVEMTGMPQQIGRALIHGPDSPGFYAVLLLTASDLASITSHIHNWVFFFALAPAFHSFWSYFSTDFQ